MGRYVIVGAVVAALIGFALLLRGPGRRAGREKQAAVPPARTGPVVFAAQDASTAKAAWSLDVFVMNPDGSGKKNLTRSAAAECDPELSREGTRIAFAVLAGEGADAAGIYTMGLDGTDRRRVTPPGTIGCAPSWSPDGKELVFTHVTWEPGDGGRLSLRPTLEVIPASGGTGRPLVMGWNPAWSPDGADILFTGADGSLCQIPATGGSQRVLISPGADSEREITGAWAPDGRRIAYGLSGSGEQFVMNRDGTGLQRLPKGAITGPAPRWSPDGKWIYYTRGGDLNESISEVWRVAPDGSGPKALARGKAFSGAWGWQMIAMLGVGREEAAQQQQPTGPTVDGTEEPALRERLRGWLVTGNEEGGLDAISLPGLQRRQVVARTKPGADNEGAIYAHAGPDGKGHLVYVENFMAMPTAKSHHTLNVVNLDGTGKRVLFDRQGDALWDHAVSEHVALSPQGDVAFATHPLRAQMPGALLQTGQLEIWSLTKGSGRELDLTVVDQGLSWSPDGRRLAVVRLLPKAEAGALPLSPDGFGTEFASWPSIPTVCLLDVTTGDTRPLHPGWGPVWSADGGRLILSDYQGRFRQVDLKTHASRPLTLPGSWGQVVAAPAADLAIYWALPTKGQKQRWTKSNSPLVGPKQEVTIKVAVPGTLRFATLLPYLDPRQQVSYGAAGTP